MVKIRGDGDCKLGSSLESKLKRYGPPVSFLKRGRIRIPNWPPNPVWL
jgi:hypothetical protein